MEYRTLKLEDYQEFSDLREKALTNYPESFALTNEEEVDTKEDRFKINVTHKFNFIAGAFEDSKLLGMAAFSREEKQKMKHKGLIWGMFVDPSVQNKKVGFNLLDFLIQKAFEIDDLKQINLAVVVSNQNAVKLYEKSGFITYGIEKDSLYNNGQYFDDLLMVRFKNS